MMGFWETFHWLRPGMLWLLLPAVGWFAYTLRRQARRGGLETIIAPHLLRHLLVGRHRNGRFQPAHLVAASWILAVLASAGPAWQREPSPFAKDDAGLVLLLEVTPEMMAQDIQPSRLVRATQKIHDLLQVRRGIRTALIAYRGSSHLVMPFTSDPQIIDMFSRALRPEIMPVEGNAPILALRQGSRLLEKSAEPGSLLLIAASVPSSESRAWEQFRREHPVPVEIYAVAAPKGVQAPPGSPPAPSLDEEALGRAASALGAGLTLVRADDGDVRQLVRRIRTNISQSRQSQKGTRWRDMGYWMVWILVLLMLPFFRKGWFVHHD